MKTKRQRYNESLEASGVVRETYATLFEKVDALGPVEMAARRESAADALGELGATFPLADDPAGRRRLLPADWTPRIVPVEEWEELSSGLLQRGYAINAWLSELYGGGQDLVPEELVASSALYRGGTLPEGGRPPVHVYGPDLVRLDSGEYAVLEDNVRIPSGVAYAEAIRRAGSRAMPDLYGGYQVSGLGAYYAALRATLEAAAPPGIREPGIAVLTTGPRDPAYFEHQRIAGACAIRLLTTGELRFENGEALAASDGRRLDVLYLRTDAGELPEGLLDAYRQGNLGLANAPGVGVADDKAIFPYVPAMIERYLGEAPILSNARTLSLADPEGLAEARERLPELVIKPREGYGGKGVLVCPEATEAQMRRVWNEVEANPLGYVAQECLDFSRHLMDDPADERYVDLRAFVLPALGYVLPGGLTRVAPPESRVVNSSAGGSFKDTWVLEEDPC
jgi:uncharacterized circularly permuted ATP-grasp superfamily protein